MKLLLADILRLVANYLDPAPEPVSDSAYSWPVTLTDKTYFYPTNPPMIHPVLTPPTPWYSSTYTGADTSGVIFQDARGPG